MCAEHSIPYQRRYQLPLLYGVAILLGLVSGLGDFTVLHSVAHGVAGIFIKIFKCISLPIIALSIIVTLSSYNAESGLQRVWQRTLLYTLTTTLIAAGVSCLLYLLIQPLNITPSSALSATFNATPTHYTDHLINVIPSTIFSPFLEHQIIGVLLIAVVIGMAIRYTPEQQPKNTIIYFFQGLHALFLVITRWVVALLPLALYGFISVALLQLRQSSSLTHLTRYLGVIILANVIQGLVVLPLWLKWHRIKPFVMLHAMLPALSVAFFSKSSSATLPVTIDMAEQRLNITPAISRFVLPICTTINMNGCAAFIFTTVIYLMQNHGMEITSTTLLLWIFIATIAAIGNAGVPMGCFFLSASLLASMNIPITLLGLILPFYTVIDMIETALNVWSDSCVAAVVQQKQCSEKNAAKAEQ